MWRYLGKQPDELWAGGRSPWRSRVEAVLVAFAIHAAIHEEAVSNIIEGLAGGDDAE